jgi:hypothetical protein
VGRYDRNSGPRALHRRAPACTEGKSSVAVCGCPTKRTNPNNGCKPTSLEMTLCSGVSFVFSRLVYASKATHTCRPYQSKAVAEHQSCRAPPPPPPYPFPCPGTMTHLQHVALCWVIAVHWCCCQLLHEGHHGPCITPEALTANSHAHQGHTLKSLGTEQPAQAGGGDTQQHGSTAGQQGNRGRAGQSHAAQSEHRLPEPGW